MKIRRLFYFGTVLAGLLFYISCRKMDYIPPKEEQATPKTIEDKFFNSHRSADQTEKAIIDFLIRVNNKDHFVEKTVKQIGYPRWDKILMPSYSRLAGRTESDSSGVTYYVPFVRDSQNYVNASLAIRATPTDTTFSYHCDWQYAQMQNSTSSTQDTAEYFAIFFMTLDKNVFGHNRFNIIDKNLFKNGNNEARFITLPNNSLGSFSFAEMLTPVEVCATSNVYYTLCPYPGSDDCTPTCDECWLCTGVLELTYCWTEWINTGGGGGGGTGGSGGGSGGGSTPPECPGTPQARTENVPDPCEPGWEPLPPTESPIDPCSKAASLKVDSLFKADVNDLKNKLTHTTEYAFLHRSTGGRVGFHGGVPNECEVNVTVNTVTTPLLRCYVHSHNNACALPMFSAADLKTLYDLYTMGKTDSVFTFGLVTNVGVYLLVIDDMSAFAYFGSQYFLEESPKDLDKMANDYSSYRISRTNNQEENEKRFLKFLKSKNVGVRLLKANDDLSGYNTISLNRDNNRVSLPCP